MGARIIWSPFDAVLASLRRSVGQYARNYDLLYLGRTKDPWTRMAAHRRTWANDGNTLQYMIKIYKTASPSKGEYNVKRRSRCVKRTATPHRSEVAAFSFGGALGALLPHFVARFLRI